MRLLLYLLVLAGYAQAQTPTKPVLPDSIPLRPFLPHWLPPTEAPDLMPTTRPTNSFYRNRTDPPNVVRATLDNMPVKVPDLSTNYTILQSYRITIKPELLPRIGPRIWP